MSAECGVWSAELQGEVARLTTPALILRIPHSTFRTSEGWRRGGYVIFFTNSNS